METSMYKSHFNYLKIALLLVIFSLSVTLVISQESKKKETKSKMEIVKESFGKTTDGIDIDAFTLKNTKGMKVKIITYGGIITELWTPDKNGKFEDIVLGFDNVKGYENGSPYFGALIGRYGNRIGKGKFTLDGSEYTLAQNDNGNHLHGGIKGFDKVIWSAEPIQGKNDVALKLSYTSKDGEEGYPGNLSVTVTYTLNDKNELVIEYNATTDKTTVVNLTSHSYFNLKGAGEGDILEHILTLNADRTTPVEKGLIPTGELKSVKGTPFDFNKPTAIGKRINEDNEQLKLGIGYDHNWVLNRKGKGLSPAAKVYEPTGGRVMEISTTEIGIQFYSGNFLDGTLTGKGNKVYKHRYGFCLETQHFPDSPNKPAFPSTTLKPGEKYYSKTVHKFSTK
jgi:aldose 1-epimerase